MKSEFLQQFSPLKQGIVSFGLGVLIMLIGRSLSSESSSSFMLAFIAIVCFCILNAFLSLFHDSFARYVWPSWGVFVGLSALLLLTARWISNTSIQQHKEYIQMLISVVIFYVLFSLMMRLMRMFWQFAEADRN